MAVSVPVLYFLVPLALILAAAAVLGFLWAVRNGQYDDVETPALRVLLEEEADTPIAPTTRNGASPSSDQPDQRTGDPHS